MSVFFYYYYYYIFLFKAKVIGLHHLNYLLFNLLHFGMFESIIQGRDG